MSASGDVRVVFERPDGGVSIDTPIRAIADDPTALAVHIARLTAEHGWTHRATARVDDLPSADPTQGRRFRNAWRWRGGRVQIDVDAARSLLLTEIRGEAQRRLVASDTPMLAAIESGARTAKAAWKGYRNALRGVPVAQTAALDSVGTVSELLVVAPAWPRAPG